MKSLRRGRGEPSDRFLGGLKWITASPFMRLLCCMDAYAFTDASLFVRKLKPDKLSWHSGLVFVSSNYFGYSPS